MANDSGLQTRLEWIFSSLADMRSNRKLKKLTKDYRPEEI